MKLNRIISIRTTEEELEFLRQASAKERQSLSGFVAKGGLDRARKVLEESQYANTKQES